MAKTANQNPNNQLATGHLNPQSIQGFWRRAISSLTMNGQDVSLAEEFPQEAIEKIVLEQDLYKQTKITL